MLWQVSGRYMSLKIMCLGASCVCRCLCLYVCVGVSAGSGSEWCGCAVECWEKGRGIEEEKCKKKGVGKFTVKDPNLFICIIIFGFLWVMRLYVVLPYSPLC